MSKALTWKCRDRVLDLTRPQVMGIVNVTPDSFSDGGLHATHEQAIEWGKKLLKEGADILDVGGESTRPGAADVSVDEELERVVPVVENLVCAGAVVSVDTSKPEVMTECLKVGAHIINDIRAFSMPKAVDAVKDSAAGLVIMHMLGQPRTMQAAPAYDDLLGEIETFLRERESVLINAGVKPEQICWDAGFGFGKTVNHNFSILKATPRFVHSGRPYLMGLSRKSSLGAVTGIEKACERVTASVAGALIAVDKGAQIVRVHDVRQTCEALAVWQATVSAE